MYHVSIKSPEILKHCGQFLLGKILLALWKEFLVFFPNMNRIGNCSAPREAKYRTNVKDSGNSKSLSLSQVWEGKKTIIFRESLANKS